MTTPEITLAEHVFESRGGSVHLIPSLNSLRYLKSSATNLRTVCGLSSLSELRKYNLLRDETRPEQEDEACRLLRSMPEGVKVLEILCVGVRPLELLCPQVSFKNLRILEFDYDGASAFDVGRPQNATFPALQTLVLPLFVGNDGSEVSFPGQALSAMFPQLRNLSLYGTDAPIAGLLENMQHSSKFWI